MQQSTILQGDCIQTMRELSSASVDFVLTDPPYGVRYRSRDGQTIANDNHLAWLYPAFAEVYRVMKPGSLCFSFYGWHAADQFLTVWKALGFRVVGHVVFAKRYAASRQFFEHRHEQGYLLAKGSATLPAKPLPDVVPWAYTGNRLHPTQKPVKPLQRLIESFCKPGGVVLDPFCGSGSTLLAAKLTGRCFIGIELDAGHHATALKRLTAA
ncbi:DNA methyltransferase [Nitrobacter vulgaris]|uniref:Methyltransferase n=1 Tax=Nitrobacter vulgaris TaxID=29421 RepID=A0A1V4I2M5_NITVU|nr:DNA methyltransferase [Nitrobacter vulgaris]OPH84365.1 DNA methylase [Nitrobacter vulgaris]